MNEASYIYSVPVRTWDGNCSASQQQDALHALEAGQVLFFPNLGFEIAAEEKQFLNPAIVAGAKNVSFNSATGNSAAASAPTARPRN